MMSAERIEEYTEAIVDLFGDNSIFSFINRTEIRVYWPGEED